MEEDKVEVLARALCAVSSECAVQISFPRSWETFPDRRIICTVSWGSEDHSIAHSYRFTMDEYQQALIAAAKMQRMYQ